MKKIIKLSSTILLAVMLGSCATKLPNNPNNACSIIHENPEWYYDMTKSYNKWGIPLNVQLAFIKQESSFRSNAQPPLKYYLGFIPKGRASSAYGYAQALDGTWDDYKNHQDFEFEEQAANGNGVALFIQSKCGYTESTEFFEIGQ